MKNIDNEARANRGGSWINDTANCRASNRLRHSPCYRLDNLGFRVVLSPPQDRFSPLPSSVLPSNSLPPASS